MVGGGGGVGGRGWGEGIGGRCAEISLNVCEGAGLRADGEVGGCSIGLGGEEGVEGAP